MRSFLTIEVIERLGPHRRRSGDLNAPFVAVGIVTRFADRIVGNDVKDEVRGAVVDELMRLAGLEETRVAARSAP